MRYAKAHGLQLGEATNCGIPGVFVDGGKSASKYSALTDRLGGAAFVAAIRPGDHVIFTSPHRAFRNLRQAENQLYEWEQDRVVVHFTDHAIRTDTANGRMIMQLLFVVAEWKSKIMVARTLEGKAIKSKEPVPEPLEKPKPTTERVTTDDTLGQIWLDEWEKRYNPAPMKVTGKVRAYVRVSKASQTVDSQKEVIRRWHETSEYAHLDLVFYIDHGKSAYSSDFRKRKEGKRLLTQAWEGDIVVCVRADRMVRSVSNMVEVIKDFEAKKVTVIMLDINLRTDTRFGKMLLGMLGFVAELESYEIDISSNSAVAMSVRAKGLPVSKIPILMLKPSAIHKRSWMRACLPEDLWIGAVWRHTQNIASGVKMSTSCRAVNRWLCDQLQIPQYMFLNGSQSYKKYGKTITPHRLRDKTPRAGQIIADIEAQSDPTPGAWALRNKLRLFKQDKRIYGWFVEYGARREMKHFQKYWKRIIEEKDSLKISKAVTIIDDLLKLYHTTGTYCIEEVSDSRSAEE